MVMVNVAAKDVSEESAVAYLKMLYHLLAGEPEDTLNPSV
jgi:hypothetical protein